jgi:hypothetical protein
MKTEMTNDIFTAATNIPSPAYFDFVELIKTVAGRINGKQLVLYGCGAQGCVLLAMLEQNGIDDFLFTDSNERFYGCTVKGRRIIPPALIYESPEDYIVIVTPQDDTEIIRSLTDRGFVAGKNLFSAGNSVYRLFLEEFTRTCRENELLLLGDCNFLACSLHDSDKTNLTAMLSANLPPTPPDAAQSPQIRALNLPAFNYRAACHILQLQKELGHNPGYVMFVLDIAQFNGFQHLAPGSQHEKLFIELQKYSTRKEFLSYIKLLGSRRRRFAKFMFAQKKSGENSFAENALYIKTRYLYQNQLDKNEEYFYLKELFNAARACGIAPMPVMMPVNIDKCRAYCGDTFDEQFDKNITLVKQGLGENANHILDLSRLLQAEYFNDDTTFDEAYNYAGRKKVCEAIVGRWRVRLSE